MFYYLASPYSSPDPEVRHKRYLEVMDCLAWMLNRRMWTYSPIVHCHDMAVKHKMPTDNEFWKDYNRVMIDGSVGVAVLKIGGWEKSVGIRDEMDYAKSKLRIITEVIPRSNGYEMGVFRE
jgi:predicted acyl esterase